jgi:hypothetical protein
MSRVSRDASRDGNLADHVGPAEVPLGLGLFDGSIEVVGRGVGHISNRLQVGTMLYASRFSYPNLLGAPSRLPVGGFAHTPDRSLFLPLPYQFPHPQHSPW